MTYDSNNPAFADSLTTEFKAESVNSSNSVDFVFT